MKKVFALLAFCLATTFTWAQVKHNAAITSKVVSVNPDDWKFIGNPATAGGYMSDTIKWNALTKDVFDNGAVLVYVVGTSGGGWHLLPHSYYSESGEIEVNFNYREGYLELRMLPLVTGKSKISTDLLPTYKYKIVVLSE
jgi:hypothetical protein